MCGMTSWNDSIEARMLSWASITPFGMPVVPDVNTSWKMSSLLGGSQAAWVASQSGGNVGSSRSGSAHSASSVVVGKRSSRASRGSGASRPVPRIKWRVSAEFTIPSIASTDMRRSSGTYTSRARMAPK